jgi:predicted TIM-barrel fold metal-dependent hydrolase
MYADMALMTAARNPNVYLETSSAPFEVIERAVSDPAIGPEKLLFGSDSLAPYTYYQYRGESYPSYGKTPPGFYTDHHKYDLANIERLTIPDREKEMILGGNAARILGL